MLLPMYCVPQEVTSCLFAAQESSEKKNKDDSDIQRALQSHLWQEVGVNRELAGRETSGRKGTKLTVCPGCGSSSWEQAPGSV